MCLADCAVLLLLFVVAAVLQVLAGAVQAHVPDAHPAVCARGRGALHQQHQRSL